MTEQEWLVCENVDELFVNSLHKGLTQRKFTLFMCAWVNEQSLANQVEPYINDTSKTAIEVTELYVNDMTTNEQLVQAKNNYYKISGELYHRWSLFREKVAGEHR